MGTWTQKNREVALKTSLGEDVLLFDSMRGREALGELFVFELDLLSANVELCANKLLGTAVSIELAAAGGVREFNGIVTSFGLAGRGLDAGDPRLVAYRAAVRPRLWLLTRGAHCRFFHDRTVLDIARQVLGDYSVDYRSECTASYPKLAHCAQYRETDFDFLCRLFEREGIYYFFEHRGGKDILVLADAPSAHAEIAHYGSIGFQYWLAGAMPLVESVHEWVFEEALVAGTSEVNAFDFNNVKLSEHQGLLARATSDEGRRAYVMADYAVGYDAQSDGHRYAQARIEAHQAMAARALGRASARGIVPGRTFALTDHPRHDQNRDYLVVQATYEVRSDGYLPAGDSGNEPVRVFDCAFTAIPKGKAYRMPLRTPRPRAGLQTAIVIAPDGDEMAASSCVQVKVQFHWEQFDPPSASTRMQRAWVRVAQGWAGKNWGAMFVPRAGQEVVIDFLGSDPDHPLVVGSVYNSANAPPYALPAHAAVATIRTKALGGNDRNELRFNDKDLQVLLYTGGRRDTYVKRNDLGWVGGDRHAIVQGKQLVKVGARHLTVTGAQSVKVGTSASLSAGANVVHKAGANYVVDGQIVHVKGGVDVVIESGAMLTLKAGGSFITLGPAGVQISGPIVGLNSGGAAGSAPGGSPEPPSEPEKADDGSSVK